MTWTGGQAGPVAFRVLNFEKSRQRSSFFCDWIGVPANTVQTSAKNLLFI
jgi:hypothetical protein